jgi:hypothetical protein
MVAANTLRICSGTGLLVEESRTNLVANSGNQAAGGWATFNITPTVSSQLAPDNSTFMTLQTVSTSSGNTSVDQLIAPITATTYTMSAFFKAGTAGFFSLAMSDFGADWAGVSVNAGTLVVTTGQAGDTSIVGTPAVTAYANSTYRVSVSVRTSAASPGGRAFLFQGSSAAISSQFLAGVSGQTTFVWGNQLEAGAFPTSYISTGASATARSADNIAASSVLATTLAGSTGTIVANTNNSQQSLAATLIDANGAVLLAKTSGNVGTTAVGATLSTANTGTWTGTNDLGLAWDGTGGAIQLNGGTIATDATARTPAATFHLGSTSGSSAFFNGYFTRLTAYMTKQASPQ